MSADGPAEVSVVIPTRDRWDLLSKSVRSALAQVQVAVEVIVVDDASVAWPPPDVPGLTDPRVRIERLDRRAREATARNTGIALASGAWIAFLDDDDVWAPDKLRLQIAAAEAAGAQFAFGASLTFDGDGPIEVDRPVPPGELLDQLLRVNLLPGGASNVIARRELMAAVGGFDTEFVQFDDWDMWIRLARAAEPAVIQDVVTAVRRHATNQYVVQPRAEAVADFARIRAKHGPQADAELFYHWLAGRSRRVGRRGAAAAEFVRCAVECRSPGNLLLAARMMLGERAMGGGRADRRPRPPEPSWLADYR